MDMLPKHVSNLIRVDNVVANKLAIICGLLDPKYVGELYTARSVGHKVLHVCYGT
jgi:hypothetical protein